jgi:hypothetical protein
MSSAFKASTKRKDIFDFGQFYSTLRGAVFTHAHKTCGQFVDRILSTAR